MHDDNLDVNMDNVLEYMYKLLSVPTNKIMMNNMESISEKSKVILLKGGKTKVFDFNLKSNEKLEMFSDGYNQMKKHFEK